MERKMLSLEHEKKAKKMEMFMKAAEISRQQQLQQQQQLLQQRDFVEQDIVDDEVTKKFNSYKLLRQVKH